MKYEIIAFDHTNNKSIKNNLGQYFVYMVIPEFNTLMHAFRRKISQAALKKVVEYSWENIAERYFFYIGAYVKRLMQGSKSQEGGQKLARTHAEVGFLGLSRN